MNASNSGVISFEGYKVKQVEFKLNENYNASEVTIDMQIGAEINIDRDTQEMTVDLNLFIFKDAIEKNYPFEMVLCLRGSFGFEGEIQDKIEKYQANALAILFPYARALVSTYTANSNVSPLILPTININNLLENLNKEE